MVLIDLVDIVFMVLYVVIVASVVLSWIPGALDHPAGYAVYKLSRPLLEPIRRLLPPMGGLDLSPLIAILLLEVIHRVVGEMLSSLVVGY